MKDVSKIHGITSRMDSTNGDIKNSVYSLSVWKYIVSESLTFVTLISSHYLTINVPYIHNLAEYMPQLDNPLPP
jgi:hypothetical protein